MFVCLMVFNATFNNISVISWRLFIYDICYQPTLSLQLLIRLNVDYTCLTPLSTIFQFYYDGQSIFLLNKVPLSQSTP